MLKRSVFWAMFLPCRDHKSAPIVIRKRETPDVIS